MNLNRINNLSGSDNTCRPKPTIVSIFSGKGGVGKSIIAFNLAAVCASCGSRTVLIDCDWYFGSLHVLANVVPGISFKDFLRDTAFEQKAVTEVRPNLDLIASPSIMEEKNIPDLKILADFCRNLRRYFADYEFVIIDSSSGIPEILSLLADKSDFNLIIINPEKTSIAAGYGLFSYLVKSCPSLFAHLLINRGESGTDCEYIYRKFSLMTGKFLDKVPLYAGYLLDDKYVIDSVSSQIPLIEKYPESSSAVQLVKLFSLLTKNMGQEPANLKKSNVSNINFKATLADIKG